MQSTIELTEQPAAPSSEVKSFFALSSWQKSTIIIILLGVLWIRAHRRRKLKVRICSHCGHKNPLIRTNCETCSAPLLHLEK